MNEAALHAAMNKFDAELMRRKQVREGPILLPNGKLYYNRKAS